MGAYVYRLMLPSAPRYEVKLDNGTVVLAAGLEYAYKPSWASEKFNRECERRYLDPRRRAWRDKPSPEYAVYTYKGDPSGGPIFKWPSGRVSCVDDPNWSGMKIVGHVPAKPDAPFGG